VGIHEPAKQSDSIMRRRAGAVCRIEAYVISDLGSLIAPSGRSVNLHSVLWHPPSFSAGKLYAFHHHATPLASACAISARMCFFTSLTLTQNGAAPGCLHTA
jgi:hypothetical protein